MQRIVIETNPGASAPTQGPPQAVSISSTLTNASPNGRTSGGDNEQQGNENETPSPTKDTGRAPRKNRLSVENLTCSSCGKVCSNKSKYMRHLSTHSEERPYSCPLCKKGFKWVEYLSKHMKQQHPNTALDITTVTSNVSQTAEGSTTTSEGNSVNISSMETDEHLDSAPPLLQGRMTIPTPVSLLPSLGTGQAREVIKGQFNGVVEKAVPSSSASSGLLVTKNAATTVAGGLADSQECSGTFMKVHQSAAVVIVCTTDTVSNATDSSPVATLTNVLNPVTMATSEKSTVTSSFESSHHDTVTFSVPILTSSTTTKSIKSIVSSLTSLKPSENVLDHSGLSGTSFDGSYSTNSSFDQSTSFSSENAVIVPEGAISCQLASSLANDGIQSFGENLTEGNIGLNTVTTANGAGVKKYVCEHEGCTKTYRYKKDVIRHMKMKHGSQPTRYEQKEVPEMLLRKHGCLQCDKMYAHRKDLLRHQRDVHSPEAIARREASKSSQKKYPCDQPNCNKFYVHKKDLIRHRRNDHNDLTDTKNMQIPEPVSPSQYSISPAKRQRVNNWASSKVVSTKAETAAEPMAASDVQWLGVTVVKEGNVSAAVMATSDTSTDTLASNCALFNTSPSSSNAATSLLSLLNSASQQALPVDTATAQLMGQTASVHPLFSAVTSNTQETATPVSTS